VVFDVSLLAAIVLLTAELQGSWGRTSSSAGSSGWR